MRCLSACPQLQAFRQSGDFTRRHWWRLADMHLSGHNIRTGPRPAASQQQIKPATGLKRLVSWAAGTSANQSQPVTPLAGHESPRGHDSASGRVARRLAALHQTLECCQLLLAS